MTQLFELSLFFIMRLLKIKIVTNKNITLLVTKMVTKRLILLIDESGSMYSQRLEIIDAINVTINSQKKLQSGNIIFDVFRFNDRIILC